MLQCIGLVGFFFSMLLQNGLRYDFNYLSVVNEVKKVKCN
jgi:hypothetical protein